MTTTKMKCEVTLVIGILCIGSVLAQYDECGKRKVQSLRKILNGKVSDPGMWPWQVGIKNGDVLGNWKTFCGGALIAPQWVLTAAHCFFVRRETNTSIWYEEDTSLTRYKVVAGDYNTDSYETTEQERNPLEIHIHPDFRYYPIPVNDIALIKLDRNVTLGLDVRTVCLPNEHEDLAKPGVFGTATGWGWTAPERPSLFLRYSKYKIQDNDLCNQTTKLDFIPTVMFCAGDGMGHSDTCVGDSGGSVVRRVLVNGQYRWVTIGIVSWGERCAVPGKYGYYTRLLPFMEWILLKTNQSLCVDLGPPRNGLRTPAKRLYQHNDVVTFGCKANYTRIGKALLLCQRNGTWDGYQPFCFGNKMRTISNLSFTSTCSDPGIPTHGIRFGNNFKHGQVVMFRCKQGYKLTGQPFIICNEGRWGKTTPNCSAPCPDPGVPRGGYRHHHSFLHGEKVRFSCKNRWKMEGEKTLTCTDGEWDHDAPKCLGCGSPLGMESKKIPDANIKSSSHEDSYHRSKYGRLNHQRAWCSSGIKSSPYLEIDLGKPYWITHLATQGSELDRRWVKEYVVAHKLAVSLFIDYRENHSEKVFTGNKDDKSIVKNKLKNPFIARRIRFYPQNDNITRACMRVEIYGCDIPNDCVMVGSRVLGKWGKNSKGVDHYYKAYVKSISGNTVQLELENEDHDDRYYKYLPKTSIVLDVPLKQEELRKGTKVLAPWGEKYYSGTIIYIHSKRYWYVKQLDKDPFSANNWFTIDGKLRRLKNERFCE